MDKIVWVRTQHDAGEVRSLEVLTGMAVTAVGDGAALRKSVSTRTRVIVLQLPLAGEAVEDAIEEAQTGQFPVSVLILDEQESLDESIIGPLMTPFRHIHENLTIEQLARVAMEARDEAEASYNRARASREPWCDLLIGESRAMRDLQAMIRLVGPRQSTVLITGESGVGKEMVARAIHAASKRNGARMISVNCAAIPENLVESELFGHTKGAFTGAVNDRVGKFEQAQRTTILLDEIGDLPLTVQPKLLRVLQEREIQRVGSSATIQVDTRVIAASNADLRSAVAEKRFREDLLYRLTVVPIHVPALRERSSDIPVLADHFIEKVCRREALAAKRLSPEAMKKLRDYSWPGNVRQLEYAIEMAVTLSGDRERLYAGDIQLPEPGHAGFAPAARPGAAAQDDAGMTGGGSLNFDEVMGRMEKILLNEALRQCGGNKAKAANLLGIPRTTLVYKVKSLEACAV